MSKSNIYDQHSAAFASVSAFVIFKGSERVATVAIKYPRDGALRLYAYLHVMGLPMVRGYASGGGYDKRSAAVASAARLVANVDYTPANPDYAKPWEVENAKCRDIAKYWNDLSPSLDQGHEWTRALENAGFTVHQAV